MLQNQKLKNLNNLFKLAKKCFWPWAKSVALAFCKLWFLEEDSDATGLGLPSPQKKDTVSPGCASDVEVLHVCTGVLAPGLGSLEEKYIWQKGKCDVSNMLELEHNKSYIL